MTQQKQTHKENRLVVISRDRQGRKTGGGRGLRSINYYVLK